MRLDRPVATRRHEACTHERSRPVPSVSRSSGRMNVPVKCVGGAVRTTQPAVGALAGKVQAAAQAEALIELLGEQRYVMRETFTINAETLAVVSENRPAGGVSA